jgi:glycine oxidase
VVTARESLVVAVDRADTADLRTVGEWLAAQGHPVTVTNAARDVEPLLAQGIRHGFRATDELAVDNRLLVEALQTHCEELGVRWAGPVEALEEARDGVHTVVIANGIDAPALWPGLAVRPVKARCCGCAGGAAVCRCRGGWFAPVCTGGRCTSCREPTVWWSGDAVRARPRHRTSVTGARELLDDACAVMPALGEYELAECAAGLRPMTPDNMPIVGRLDDRTLVATGHGRSGFLLAPWTAERIAAELLVGARA